MAGGSGGNSRFLEARSSPKDPNACDEPLNYCLPNLVGSPSSSLTKTQTKRDGGFTNNWSFEQAEDSEGDAERDEANLLSVDESDGSDSPNEEPKSKPIKPEAVRGESLKTYERKTTFVTVRPLKGNAIGLNMLGASKKLGDNAQNIPVTPGTILHGRRFHHANSQMPVVKTAAQRKEYPPHVQKIESDQDRVPLPHGADISASKVESEGESECEIRRKVQQKRRCSSYSADLILSPPAKICPTRLDGSKKKHVSEQTEYLKLCPTCGKESKSQTKCQSCSELQRHPRQAMASSESTGALSRPSIHQNLAAQKSLNLGLNATNFYGNSFANVPVDILLNHELGRNLLPTNGKVGISDGINGPKTARTIKLRGIRPPEMNDPIVLSSDDEEEDNFSTGSASRVESTSPCPADSACSSPAPSSGKVEAAFKENNKAEQRLSGSKAEQRLSGSKAEQRLSGSVAADTQHTVTLPRKARMRDQYGNAAYIPSVKRHKVKQEIPQKSPCDSVILNCRSIRIGTLSRMVIEPVIFGIDTIKIRIEDPESDLREIHLKTSEITKCEWCNSRLLAMVYLQTVPAACHTLRSQLSMSREKDNVWYDCKSPNLEEQYIILIFEDALDIHASGVFEKVIIDIGVRNKIIEFVTELDFDKANAKLVAVTKNHEEILKRSLPQKDNKIKNVASESSRLLRSTSSPLQFFDDDDDVGESHSVFIGPIVKLIVYPPPPAKGGISVTNEDLHCLNEGEFLNDVIIDFYLKYLVLEKLRKDADRIHVFSSFFYKRLNQRERRNLQETANLSIQQRRHGRVKTWTRHVDIFQKDFIFVPLNEAAHWFLAVICFPGLEEPKHEPNPFYQGNVTAEGPSCSTEDDPSSASQDDSEDCLKSPLTKTSVKKTPSKKHVVGLSDTNIENEDNDTLGARKSACRGKRGLKNGDEENSEVEESELRQSHQADFRTRGQNDIQNECKTPVKPLDALGSIRLSYSDDAAEEKEDEFIDSSEDQDNLDESSDEGGLADDTFTSESGKWHLKPSICKQPCILLMDSLRGPSRSNVVKTLREYLEVEWEVRKGSKRSFSKDAMKGSNPRVPQQNNFSDCGVYILQYVESFFENPIQSFDLPMNLSDWFPQQRMKTKREEIRNLILKLQENQNKEKTGQKDISSTAQPPVQEETQQLTHHSSTD